MVFFVVSGLVFKAAAGHASALCQHLPGHHVLQAADIAQGEASLQGINTCCNLYISLLLKSTKRFEVYRSFVHRRVLSKRYFTLDLVPWTLLKVCFVKKGT